MNDITDIWESFIQQIASHKRIKELSKKLENGKATYSEAQEYSSVLSNCLVNFISKEFPTDSSQVLEALENATICKKFFNQIDDYTYSMQNSLNTSNNIGLNAVKVVKPKQIINDAFNLSNDYDKAIDDLSSQAELSANKHIDTIQQANAKFQSKAGYEVTVSRTYDGRGLSDKRSCKWCLERVGYNVPYKQAVSRGMFQRHEGCHCVIEYNNNGEKSYQSSKGGRDSWKLNEELSQPYKKLVRTEKENISISSRSIRTTINSRKVEGYSGVYISDNATIKPKALHELNKYNNTLVEKYNIQEKPNILIVSNEELNYSVAGLYSPIKNMAIYPPDVTKETQRHEMKHCQQADSYKKNGGTISESSYNKYIDEICKKSKQHLNSLGINEENVSELSQYAKDMFDLGRFDEVEAEYEALKGDS